MRTTLRARPPRATSTPAPTFRPPPLDAQTELALATRWRDAKDPSAGRQLVVAHLPIVRQMARSFRGYGVPFEELVSAGNEGLVKALHRFELRGVPFRAYARFWIRAHLFETVLRARSVTASKNDFASRWYFQARSELVRLRARYGSDPEELRAQLARRLGKTEEEVRLIVAHIERCDLSLDRRNPHTDEAPIASLSDDAAESAEAWTERRQEVRRFQRFLDEVRGEFDAREWATLQRRLLADEPETLEQIARDFGVTRERIRQIEGVVLRRLRRLASRHYGRPLVPTPEPTR